MKKLLLTLPLLLVLLSCNVIFNNKVIINEIANNPIEILKPSDSLKFYFDTVEHNDYDYLLDSIINPGMNKKWGKRWKQEDTWTISRKLRIWCREFLNKDGWGEGNHWKGDYTIEIYSIPKLLEHNKDGEDGLCSYYATFFMHSCLAVGINNRRVGWWQPGGDQLNEVYIPEQKKWVAMSPLYNCWYSDQSGPLSLIEINAYKHKDSLEQITTQRDFQTTLPDPEVKNRNNWLANYSWDIYYWNKNGYLIMDAPKAYRFENPEDWPYKHFETKLITNATQKEDLINFDASLILVSTLIENYKITISIDDYHVINFKEFRWSIKNAHGEEIKKNSFTTLKEDINLEEISSGNYLLSVFALNTRSGKSQTVEIKFSIK